MYNLEVNRSNFSTLFNTDKALPGVLHPVLGTTLQNADKLKKKQSLVESKKKTTGLGSMKVRKV